MARVFVACHLPESVRSELALAQCGVPGARWVAPELLHLTLTFIGDVDGGKLDRIVDTLGSIDHPTLAVRLAGCGVFPPSGSPRVLWMGVAPTEAITQLKAKIDRRLTVADIEFERRKFHAHVTLARFAHRPHAIAIAEYVVRHGAFSSDTFDVSEFVLYESILSPRGARYYRRAVFRLE